MKRFLINRLYAAYKALKDPQMGASAGLGSGAVLHANVANRHGVSVGTNYKMDCIRADGSLRWSENFHNIVTDAGLDYILHRLFNVDTAIPAYNTGTSTAGSDYGGRRVPRHWTASQAMKLGEYIQPTATNYNEYYFICGARTGDNKTGGTEPSGGTPWQTGLGASTTDGNVTWYRADWYIGIKDETNGAPGDIFSAKGWTEHTDYSQATRVALNPNASTSNLDSPDGRRLASEAVAVFNISGTLSIGGAFLTNFPIKGNTANGLLYGNGEFATRSAVDGDTLNVTTQIDFRSTAD